MRFGKMLCLLEAPGRFTPPCFGRIHLHMLHMEEFMKLHKGSEYFFFFLLLLFIYLFKIICIASLVWFAV